MRIINDFEGEIDNLKQTIVGDNGQWGIKGFIDINKNIYSITADTKVVSKVLELALFPALLVFANKMNYELQLSPHQNYYPDVTFKDKANGDLYAIDLKTTYRKTPTHVNGMTLGAFTGYFRNRTSTKNVRHAYGNYKAHFVLGVIYTRTDMEMALKHIATLNVGLDNRTYELISAYLSDANEENWEKLYSKVPSIVREKIDECLRSELRQYSLDDFDQINSVATNFKFFFLEKWKIAIDRPGSGNTKNIGSVSDISKLLAGQGTFSELPNGKDVFDNYWQNYETLEMARAAGREKPMYKNLQEYKVWEENRTPKL